MSAMGRLVGVCAVVVVLGGAGCAPETAATRLQRVLAAHARADAAIAQGDAAAARAALLDALAVSPAGLAGADARVLRADTCFRLARLALAAHEPAVARGWATAGLGRDPVRDIFRANLLVARGEAHEALGMDRAALADYHEALRIDEALLHATAPPAREPAKETAP